MHNAPSVSYPVGRSFLAGALAAALWLLGLLVTYRWQLESPVGGWRLGIAALVLALAGLSVAWTWWNSPTGTVAWDGHSWCWSSAGSDRPGAVEACLDLQQFLLLYFDAEGGSRWLWLERSRCAGRWDDLRRAVYSRARPKTPPEAQAGAGQT